MTLLPCRNKTASLLCSLFLLLVVSPLLGEDPVPRNPSLRYWKGNLHTHSLWSDGNDFPEMIAEWYRVKGYNFLALSDHNILSEGVFWRSQKLIKKRGGKDALKKYRNRFGKEWVETRGKEGTDKQEVRLKPLNEFRALLEERGRFIMIPSEEISDSSQGKPLHMNVTNIKKIIAPVKGATMRETLTIQLRAVELQSKETGREMMLHLNHPNFYYAVTAEDIAHVVEDRFYEVYNGHPGVNHLGDHVHHSIEHMWDIANTIRLGQLGAAPLYGIGTDDSHYYHGYSGKKGSRPGRGWVMVRSRYLTPEHLIKAMKRGDFYASSGVSLDDVQYDKKAKKLSLKIQAKKGVTYTTQFIGTTTNFDKKTTPQKDKKGKTISPKYSADVGRILATVKGGTPSYKLKGDELYVRAVVTSSENHPDPSFKKQKTQAWVQPVGWEKYVTKKK